MHDARDRNAGIWIEYGEQLTCSVYSSVASLIVRFSGHFRKANGEVQVYSHDIVPTSDRVVTSLTRSFQEGFLLSCIATIVSGNANRGQCYVRARVQSGEGAAAIPLHRVLAGYATDDFSPSFPYGIVEGPLEGAGMIRSVAGTNPAAGVEVSETVPTGARWRILSLTCQLVNDATVGNRQVFLIIDDGTTTLAIVGFLANQTANATDLYSWSNWGASNALSALGINFPLPAFPLMAGWRIRTSTGTFQAGDNWGAPALMVEEWLEA